MDMLIFPFPAYKRMAKKLSKETGILLGSFAAMRFLNQEVYITSKTNVSGKTCIVLGSIAPPDEQLLSILLLSHTLKKEGAKRIILLLPYLGYSRHDKDKKGESCATACVGQMLAASGVDEVVTIDVHSDVDIDLFPIPLISLSPTELFANVIHEKHLTNATIVAPDRGAIRRADALALSSQTIFPASYITKKRTKKSITHFTLHGDVSKQVIIIDDILDTGATLLSAVRKLREAGAKEMIIMVTHGLFTGTLWKKLFKLGVKTIYTTDSVMQKKLKLLGNMRVISIVPLLRHYLTTHKKEIVMKHIHKGELEREQHLLLPIEARLTRESMKERRARSWYE